MRSFSPIPVFALLSIFLVSLAGCGGSDNGTASPSPSASTNTPLRSEFVGDWEGSWSVKPTGGGTATLSVQRDGRYTMNLENYQNSQETLEHVTLTGIMSQNGNFSASVPGFER